MEKTLRAYDYHKKGWRVYIDTDFYVKTKKEVLEIVEAMGLKDATEPETDRYIYTKEVGDGRKR